jgi:hypothetical protein
MHERPLEHALLDHDRLEVSLPCRPGGSLASSTREKIFFNLFRREPLESTPASAGSVTLMLTP